MSMFKLSDLSDFKKYEKIGTTRKNRKNKARRRERKREWKANNPRPETTANVQKRPEKVEIKPESVNDVLKAVSASRKKGAAKKSRVKTCGNCKHDDDGCCRFEYIRHDSDYTCEKFEPTVAKNATTIKRIDLMEE